MGHIFLLTRIYHVNLPYKMSMNQKLKTEYKLMFHYTWPQSATV